MAQFYTGLIGVRLFADEDDACLLGDAFLAELLQPFQGRQVHVCYAFSAEPITPVRLLALAVMTAEGVADAALQGVYSEITGWLWLEERGKVGGHDIIDLFGRHEDEYGALGVGTGPIDLSELVGGE